MSIETERYELRQEAHEQNIEHLKRELALKQKELEYFENMEEPIFSEEPQFTYENEEDFGLMRLESMKNHLRKQANDLNLEIKNNELSLRDLVESEDVRSNRQ